MSWSIDPFVLGIMIILNRNGIHFTWVAAFYRGAARWYWIKFWRGRGAARERQNPPISKGDERTRPRWDPSVELVLLNKIDAQWQKHGWNRPTKPLDKSVSPLDIHSQIIPTKMAGWWRHWPFVQVKSHTIFYAIRREQIIWVLWMARKMSISCHKINCCLSANILKGTSNITSHI